MKRYQFIILNIFIVLFYIYFLPAGNSQTKFKKFKIEGLKIFKEEDLVKKFSYDKLPVNISHFKAVARGINDYYRKLGYALVKTYLVEETDQELTIYIEEGRLCKIIFYGLNSIDVLKMKYEFELEGRIYNKYQVEKELRRLKKKFGFKDITALIKPARNYDSSLIQIDREYDIIILGPTRLPFFENYGQQYDLKIYFVKYSGDSKGFSYGFRTSYTKGLIPYIGYRFPSLITEKDLLELRASIGVLYGLDLDFGSPPKWTFMEFRANYYFTPTLKEYFTPQIRSSIYRTRAARTDIGLSEYDYRIIKGSLLPGVTLLKKFKFYAGYGGEKAFIIDSKEEPDAQFKVDIEQHTEYWQYFELGTSIDLIPWTLKRTIRRNFNFNYGFYRKGTDSTTFSEFTVEAELDFEFKNFDVYNFDFNFMHVWGMPPFYHEIPVDDSTFKGFMGRSFHSRKILRASNEYRISVYRDFVFTGIYGDFTWFEGSGYDLRGNQYGIAYGIAGHFLFLDQFEFNIFFGRDYLYSTEEAQYNIKLSAHKKW